MPVVGRRRAGGKKIGREVEGGELQTEHRDEVVEADQQQEHLDRVRHPLPHDHLSTRHQQTRLRHLR